MGINNFFEQKAKLDEIQDDLDNLKLYVTRVGNYMVDIDICWVGNKDKKKIVNAIQSHLQDVNKTNTDINVFKETATFVLMKMNELGSLIGLNAPKISQISLPVISFDFKVHTKIQIDTTALREVANRIDKERKYLDEVASSIGKTRNIVDVIILSLLGLNFMLQTLASKIESQKHENQRIVYAIRRICDLYETTEKGLQQRINEGLALGSTRTGIRMPLPQFVFTDFRRGYIQQDRKDLAAIVAAGIFDIGKKITGQYEKSLIEKNLKDLLSKMNHQKEMKEIPDGIKDAIDVFRKTGKWNEQFYKNNKDLIDGMGDISVLMAYGDKGLDAIEYLFTDYSSSIETLNMLKQSNLEDSVINEVVNEMITEYTDKVRGSVNNVIDSCIEEGVDKALGMIPGIAQISFATDVITGVTGIDAYAESLETNVESQIYSTSFNNEFKDVMAIVASGQGSEADIVNAEKYFELTRASLIQHYESGLEIAKTDIQKAQIAEDLSKLNNLSFDDIYVK